MAEHPAVNRRVVGSSPTSGAKLINHVEAVIDWPPLGFVTYM